MAEIRTITNPSKWTDSNRDAAQRPIPGVPGASPTARTAFEATIEVTKAGIPPDAMLTLLELGSLTNPVTVHRLLGTVFEELASPKYAGVTDDTKIRLVVQMLKTDFVFGGSTGSCTDGSASFSPDES